MQETVRYTYRLRPGAQAERALLAEWHRCRFLWNEAVHQQKIGRKPTLGHWYASFVVGRDIKPAPQATGAIGIDWGVTTTATTTDPAYDLPHAGHRKRCAAELAKSQRKMSRRYRRGVAPTKGCQRARRQTAQVHKKAARQNIHAARIWARGVVAAHYTIAVEDFRPRFLTRTTMARKAADAAIGTIKRTLIEYGVRAGRKVVLVSPAYTTMTCSQCGTRTKERLGLADRTFLCATCGYADTRDRNAARVILAVAERGHAAVDGVRHPIPPSVVGCRGAA